MSSSHCTGVVEIGRIAREVGAVVGEQIEVSLVCCAVVVLDEAVVLFIGRGDLKAVGDFSDVCHAHEHRPHAFGVIALGHGGDGLQVCFGVLLAHLFDGGDVGPLRNIFGSLDGVEIRDEGDCNPIELSNTGVAADDYTSFAWLAAAQLGRRLGADPIEIDCRMTIQINAARRSRRAPR